MIEVTYWPGKRLTVEGHSGFDEKGRDIVCSAATILAYTLCEALCKEHAGDVSYCMEDGNADVSVARKHRDTTVIFAAIASGYGLLEKNYPGNVHVKKFPVGDRECQRALCIMGTKGPSPLKKDRKGHDNAQRKNKPPALR